MKSVGKKGGKKIGRNKDKRCQKQYVSVRRSETNHLKRERRAAKRAEKFLARRAAGKRCARHDREKGRGKCGRQE